MLVFSVFFQEQYYLTAAKKKGEKKKKTFGFAARCWLKVVAVPVKRENNVTMWHSTWLFILL